MSNSNKTFKNPLYEELPDKVLKESECTTSVETNSCRSVEDFVSGILPVGEAASVKQDIRRTNIGLRLNSRIMKRVKPRGRRVGLSQRERRAVGLFRLPRINITYEEALPMNSMWQAYMHRFLNFETLRDKEWYNPKSGNLWDQMSNTLLKADYHGAYLKVASSRCSNMIGLEGIVVIDTKFTFQIIGKDNVCRTVPKDSCIFEVFFKNYKFKIFGKYFCIRSSERSTKKIKRSFIPAL